jgi:hypothetical protein
MDANPSPRSHHREPWNKGKLIGQKAPFKPKDVWALRVRLQQEHRARELALLNLGVGIGQRVAYDHRDFNQPRTLRRTPTLGAEVNEAASLRIDGMHDDRLQDAVLPNVFGEFVELGLGDIGARVVRVFAQRRQRQQERIAVQRRRCRRFLRIGRRCSGIRSDISTEQLQLSWLRFDPRREAHARIVPRLIARWKRPAARGSPSQPIARSLGRARRISGRLASIDETFQLRASVRTSQSRAVLLRRGRATARDSTSMGALERNHLRAIAQLVQIVGPGLQHAAALLDELGSVVGTP